MKKYFFSLLLISEIALGQTPSNDSHWILMWQDTFDFFDSEKWIKAEYCDHIGEPQLYLAQNVFTLNGNLIIRAEDISVNCPANPPVTSWICGSCSSGIHSYRSGWIETKNAFNVQYGYIEARIKLPYGGGLWPAFWTWTTNPSYQEIDIFEMYPGASEECDNRNFTHSNLTSTTCIHYAAPHDGCNDPDAFRSVLQISDYTQWHTYGIEWSPSRIIWYVDNYPVQYYHNNGITAPTSIILNLAINPDPDVTINSSFPADMLVDYVKVYQLNEDCNDLINSTTYDFSTYNNVEKNFIKIGQGGGNNALTNGQNVKLRASQFIEISGDFNVPLGASLYLDANGDCSPLASQCTQTFNPCTYDFSNYDNSVKRIIELGGNECPLSITPTNNNISLEATEGIYLMPGITIAPTLEKSVELKIVPCH